MDVGLAADALQSFRLFQQSILDEYEKMVNEYGLTVIDATLPINDQQKKIREIVLKKIKNLKKFPKHYNSQQVSFR
jgi:dTMP kinase